MTRQLFNDVIWNRAVFGLVSTVLLGAFAGCEGRSIVDDNPVFAAAPPRKSLVNTSSLTNSDRPDAPTDTQVQLTGLETSKAATLRGNSVVAEVNGQPVFVDDLIASLRLAIENDPKLTEDQRQEIMRVQIQRLLPEYIRQEIVIQALKRKIPEDRRQLIRESLEPGFQEILSRIKSENDLTTDEELNRLLSREGQSIDLLREAFTRLQMVNGYVATLAEVPSAIDRSELVEYYRAHLNEYTPPERVRWQEIVIRFDRHGGAEGAEKKMIEVVQQLNAGADFGTVAQQHSDALSAEKRGDAGWLQRNSLADSELEQILFDAPIGYTSKVFVRDNRLEVFRVSDHQQSRAIPFSELQKEIEELLISRRKKAAEEQVIADLRESSHIQTVFDEVSDH